MNYRDLTVDEILKFGFNVKVDQLSPLLKDKGVLSTIKVKRYRIIDIFNYK